MEENLQERLAHLKAQGKTKLVVLGRFQPFHKGHEDMIRAALATGLTVYISIDHRVDEKYNPYSPPQRKQMIHSVFPEIDLDHILVRKTVASGNGPDITENIDLLIKELSVVTPPEETVIFYARKMQDKKDIIINGVSHQAVHVIDFLCRPHGPYELLEMSPEAMKGVRHASNFRKNVIACNDMLAPQVAAYVMTEHALANMNNRPVGAGKIHDKPIINAAQSPDASISTGEYQQKLLKEGKVIIVGEYKDPKHKDNSR